MTLSEPVAIARRMASQRFTRKIENADDYLHFARLCQPITTGHNAKPGSAPRLVHRCTFGDRPVAERLRTDGQLVKGRFAAGKVAYVLATDLELYCAAFVKPAERLGPDHKLVLDTVAQLEPITARQLKEETGLLSKRIGPVLQRLQQACLVFEDQSDGEWDRPWLLFATEWPDVQIERADRDACTATVLERAVAVLGYATAAELVAWSGFRQQRVDAALERLVAESRVRPVGIDIIGPAFEARADHRREPAPTGVLLLHKADMLSRACAAELEQRFGGLEVLQYLLIDGRFRGAVVGHWRIGPHDVEDVVVALGREEVADRKQEILAAVATEYHPPHSRVVQYAGKPVA